MDCLGLNEISVWLAVFSVVFIVLPPVLGAWMCEASVDDEEAVASWHFDETGDIAKDNEIRGGYKMRSTMYGGEARGKSRVLIPLHSKRSTA